MTPTSIYALFTLFGLALGIVIGYGLFYLEYHPIMGYLKAVKYEQKMREMEK